MRTRAFLVRLAVAALLLAVAPAQVAAAGPGAQSQSQSQSAATEVIGTDATWQYWRSLTPPAHGWAGSGTVSWPSGPAPLGTGSYSGLNTVLDANVKPLQTYFRRSLAIPAGSALLTGGAQIKTWADDAVVVYVNGYEVGRKRMDPQQAPEHEKIYATSAIRTTAAVADPVTFNIPAAYLKAGDNVIAAVVLANYRNTADVSFAATVTSGGGGNVAAPVRPDPNLVLSFADEFNGTSLDRSVWDVYNRSTYGDGNNELACLMDRPENITVSGGSLHLIARREATPIACGNDPRFPNGRSYTSAQIHSYPTHGGYAAPEGRVEIRAKLPTTQGSSKGLWPAFWMRPVDNGNGEIDILEAIGSDTNDRWLDGIVYQALHHDYVGTPVKQTSNLLPQGGTTSGAFHTYAVEWNATRLRFFVDGALTAEISQANLEWYEDVFGVGRDFFIRLNLAVGGNWPGTPTANTTFPSEYLVDYVRWYLPA